MGELALVLEAVAAIFIVASFPILCLTPDFWTGLRVGACLLGMGISLHLVLAWFFNLSFVGDEDSHDE